MVALKNRQRRKIIIAWVFLIIAISTIIYSGNYLYRLRQAYRESYLYYQELQSLVYIEDEQADSDILPLSIDFEALKKVNNSLVAWLYSPDTKINYPVVSADNYDWYFRHLPDDSEGAYGTPFLDIDGEVDFSRQLNVIYGKKIGNEEMFGSLRKYKSQKYFEEHPYLYLYTEAGNYRIELKYGAAISTGKWRERAFMYDTSLESLLGYSKVNTTFKSDVESDSSDKFIVLNALEKGYDKKSYFVIGVLRPI